ncbi:hypothetical protein [Spongiimicrobium sp. 3-5]|uniref:hypothetical protein n=1 Tax=Spongiimicrobium sp. 3-5 TaxID=3332596 RepID=UPI0039810E72
MKRYCLLFSSVLLVTACGKDSDLFSKIQSVPTAVTLVFPENNSECTAGDIISETQSEVTFEWSDAEIADSYEVFLTNLSTGVNEQFISNESQLDIRLSRGTPYTWYVVSKVESSANTAESDRETFYNAGPGLRSFIPFPAQNIAPVDGADISTGQSTITLVWEASDLDGDISEYDIYFEENDPPSLFETGVSNSQLENIEITAGTTYYWKIVTRDLLGNESNSETFTFQVQN